MGPSGVSILHDAYNTNVVNKRKEKAPMAGKKSGMKGGGNILKKPRILNK